MDSNQALSAQFHEVITQHKGIFLKIARTYCRNEEDKQDLVQEMMIQVWRGLPRYDNKYPVSTWLYRVALNVAISFYRKQRRRLPMAGPVLEETMVLTDEHPSVQQKQLQLLEQ